MGPARIPEGPGALKVGTMTLNSYKKHHRTDPGIETKTPQKPCTAYILQQLVSYLSHVSATFSAMLEKNGMMY